MKKLNYSQARFLLSAAQLTQLPPDTGVEVAFVGRSNAGKSSVLNRATRIKNLARVSKTPGRTQLINIFAINEQSRLIDLPGYGYAKVPLHIKQQWQKLLDNYLQSRQCLKGLILVMDSRHPLTDFDQHMLSWCQECDLAVHILLNKSDKLASGKLKQTLNEVEKAVSHYSNTVSVQTFSALKGLGVDELTEKLNEWFRT